MSCIGLAEIAYFKEEYDLAINMIDRTDLEKYPYAIVLKTLIHYGNLKRYGGLISDDISAIMSSLSSSNWRKTYEEVSAYSCLSIIYANGVPGFIKSNVPYAYECILKCASLNEKIAESELKKYSKGLLGRITYKAI